MSGHVIQPGDHIIVSWGDGKPLSAEDAQKIKAALEDRLSGVTVTVISGRIEGVYRKGGVE